MKVAPSLEADTNTEILSGILGIFSDKHFKKQILIEICHLEKFSPLLRYVKYLTNFQIFIVSIIYHSGSLDLSI